MGVNFLLPKKRDFIMSNTINEYRPEKNLLMFTAAGAVLGFIAGKVLGIAGNYILMAIIAVIGSFAMLAFARIKAGAKYGISQDDCVKQTGDYAFFKNKSLEMRDLSGKVIKDNGIEAVPKLKEEVIDIDSMLMLSLQKTQVARRFFVGRFVFAFFAAAIFF
jgi:hypothetical protein